MLHVGIWCNTVLQGVILVTWCYPVLLGGRHGVTWCYRLLCGFTRCYRVLHGGAWCYTMLGPFPAPPMFLGKSPGVEVVRARVYLLACTCACLRARF